MVFPLFTKKRSFDCIISIKHFLVSYNFLSFINSIAILACQSFAQFNQLFYFRLFRLTTFPMAYAAREATEAKIV